MVKFLHNLAQLPRIWYRRSRGAYVTNGIQVILSSTMGPQGTVESGSQRRKYVSKLMLMRIACLQKPRDVVVLLVLEPMRVWSQVTGIISFHVGHSCVL